jgi:hypothetical protein
LGRVLIDPAVARLAHLSDFPSWFFPVILLQTFASPMALVLRNQIIQIESLLNGTGLATSL